MSLYAETVESKDLEIARLRELAHFGQIPGKKRVPATVCGFSMNENRLTLDVGTKQGVKLGCPVECAEGLIGTVEDVGPNESQVLMLTSAGLQPTSSGKTEFIGAKDIDRQPAQVGVVRGENASTLSMTFWDTKAPVQIGDTIVTLGASDKIPPGLMIGKVIQTESNDEFGWLKARIDPAFSVGTLDAVFVLV